MRFCVHAASSCSRGLPGAHRVGSADLDQFEAVLLDAVDRAEQGRLVHDPDKRGHPVATLDVEIGERIRGGSAKPARHHDPVSMFAHEHQG
jgi:hypothetical protein